MDNNYVNCECGKNNIYVIKDHVLDMFCGDHVVYAGM